MNGKRVTAENCPASCEVSRNLHAACAMALGTTLAEVREVGALITEYERGE